MPEFLSPEEENDERQEASEVAPPSALAILNQSEHAAMVQTANLASNRRKLDQFDSKLMAYANHSQPVALSMFYSLPRAGKQVIGPSVRFAEVVAPCWRNCAVGARGIGDNQTTVVAQGVFLDYEANLRNSIEVPRRITDKNGNRYSDDMIVTTLNAAMSVARRNAVLKGGVPQALWTPAYDAAQLTAVGKANSHAQRVADAMDYLHKLGVTEWQILNAVGVPSVRELETEHLVTLRVLCQEIKRGDKTIEMVFGSAYDTEITALFAQLKLNQAQQTMLRSSYMGRAEELVKYLRDRTAPAQQGKPASRPAGEKKFDPAERQAQAVAELKEREGQPDDKSQNPTISDDSNAPHLWTDKEVADLKARGVIVEDSPAARNLTIPDDSTRIETKQYSDGTVATGVAPLPDQSPAQQDARDEMPWGRQEKPKATDFAFGENDPTTVTGKALPPFDGPVARPQTSMEPPQKRRGRPTREEVARRQQGSILGPQSEETERKQAEGMIAQTDAFDF